MAIASEGQRSLSDRGLFHWLVAQSGFGVASATLGGPVKFFQVLLLDTKSPILAISATTPPTRPLYTSKSHHPSLLVVLVARVSFSLPFQPRFAFFCRVSELRSLRSDARTNLNNPGDCPQIPSSIISQYANKSTDCLSRAIHYHYDSVLILHSGVVIIDLPRAFHCCFLAFVDD